MVHHHLSELHQRNFELCGIYIYILLLLNPDGAQGEIEKTLVIFVIYIYALQLLSHQTKD